LMPAVSRPRWARWWRRPVPPVGGGRASLVRGAPASARMGPIP